MLQANVERWRAVIRKGFLNDMRDERTHPHKRGLYRLLAAYFSADSEEEKLFFRKVILGNFGYAKQDRKISIKDNDKDESLESGDEADLESIGTDDALIMAIRKAAKEAERAHPQLIRGGADGTGSSSRT
jgi:hypothetical protein